MLSDFYHTANAIAATTRKSEKERLLADYLVALDDASLGRAVVFFPGSPLAPLAQRTVAGGGAASSDTIVDLARRPAQVAWAVWANYGDAGDTVAPLSDDDPTR